MFGSELLKPEFIKATGLIQLEYIDDKIRYDISSGGGDFNRPCFYFHICMQTPIQFCCLTNLMLILKLSASEKHFNLLINLQMV